MTVSEAFAALGEPFAEGFFEEREKGKFVRYANAFRRFFEKSPLPDYHGGALYPEGDKFAGKAPAVRPDYSYTHVIDWKDLRDRGAGHELLHLLHTEMDVLDYPKTPHTVGGYCYNHSLPNYERIEREGLDSYETRVRGMAAGELREGLLLLLSGVRAYHGRIVRKLKEENAPEKLLDALGQVPFGPARTLYEAMVCRNFIYYVDGCDNPGRLDADLIRFYRGENIEDLLCEFFDHVDANQGWTSAIGPDYNPLTIQVLHAIRGRRRPQIELRVTPDMPDDVWSAAVEAVKSGCGHPSFYNEPRYQKRFRETFPDASPEDLKRFNGGGCTESMFEGITRAGSLDAGINTTLVFSDALRDFLADSPDFDAFYRRFCGALREAVGDTLDKVEYLYRQKAAEVPQPVRTLLIDDCIDRGVEYNAGGARLSYSVINFAGLINTADSLLAVRELVFEKKVYDPRGFLEKLGAEDPELFRLFAGAPHFGTDDERADALAAEFVGDAFGMLRERKTVFGTPYLASSIQFVTYTDAGKGVPATPDGRKNGAPLCDSLGALEGKAVRGPTAMLNSVSKLPLAEAVGTPVLNLRLSKSHVDAGLRPLVEAFFRKGGMQMQVNCYSREDMEDAMVHPECHGDLIVRTGGYSEYFNRLSPDMKKTLLERREF